MTQRIYTKNSRVCTQIIGGSGTKKVLYTGEIEDCKSFINNYEDNGISNLFIEDEVYYVQSLKDSFGNYIESEKSWVRNEEYL